MLAIFVGPYGNGGVKRATPYVWETHFAMIVLKSLLSCLVCTGASGSYIESRERVLFFAPGHLLLGCAKLGWGGKDWLRILSRHD